VSAPTDTDYRQARAIVGRHVTPYYDTGAMGGDPDQLVAAFAQALADERDRTHWAYAPAWQVW
jgi:hypothetical protein